jgi:hypothetical protein
LPESDEAVVRLDLDGWRGLSVGRMVRLLGRMGYRPQWLSERRSPGGRGWHVEIGIRPAPRTAMEMVAVQAILGSDRGREAYNLERARQVDAGIVSSYWAERWNVLYG